MPLGAYFAVLLCLLAVVVSVMSVRSERKRWADVARAVPGAAAEDPTALERAVREAFAEMRLAAQRAQAESRLSRVALDSLHIGVVMADDHGRVLFRNEAALRLLGEGGSEPIGLSVLDEVLRDAVDGRAGSRPVELFGPPRRFLVVTGSRVTGEAAGALVVIEDVTERRRTDAIRRDFVANIGHELRTPVGALAVLAETLAESADDEDPSTLRRLAGRADAEAHRLTAIVDDLLSLARLEADEETEHVPVAVAQVVTEAAERATSTAERYGLAIDVEPVDPSLYVCGDRRQLVTGVHNLLVNAVKYSDKGLPVQVRVQRTDDSTVAIQVRDRGIGIPARDRERIFERFYRVDRARARDTGGTGLGLAIVRHVAMNHHGSVTVKSLEGEGSTFSLQLPTVEHERQAAG